MADSTTPDTTPAYSLLPWVRRGIASQISGTPDVNYATLPVKLSVNGSAIPSLPHVRLPGPGDVKSIDQRAFIRTDPRDGADNFEPNYLAVAELATPDLPWIFTPSANSGDTLRPWICLIVVPDREGVTLVPRPNAPAVLTINSPLDPRAELPDLTEIDAWAHAQISGTDLTPAALEGDNPGTLSRLVASRKLEPSQRYIACVVPTFHAGVNAGLGLEVQDDDLAPAWGASPVAPVALPVYFSFRFQTGPGGDFASLARKIGPPTSPISAGSRIIDVSDPSFGAAPANGVTLGLEGALRTFHMPSHDWPSGAQAPYETQLREALAPPAAADPIVSPPVYGHTQTAQPLPAGGQPPVWLGELNLDPRSRTIAAAGGQVVQAGAEAMAASAWNQLGEIRKANQLLRQAQLAREVSSSLDRRHLQTVAADGTFLQITGPTHARVSLTLGGVQATLRRHIQASRVPNAAVSAGMRRLARPRGPLGRQLAVKGPQQLVDRLNIPAGGTSTTSGSPGLVAAGPRAAPQGMVTLDGVSPAIQLSNMSVVVLHAAAGWQQTTTTTATPASTASTSVLTSALSATAERKASPELAVSAVNAGDLKSANVSLQQVALVEWKADPNIPAILQSGVAYMPAPLVFPSVAADLAKMQSDFRGAATSITGYLNTTDAAPVDPPSLGGAPALAYPRALLSAALDPAVTIKARFGARLPLNTGPDPLQPLTGAPRFPQAMYAPLAALSPEWMLPGISSIPSNAAILLQTNPSFVEAFMVGLNEEFSRELLWRQFPSERKDTWFQNFWADGGTPDITAIATFDPAGHLGDHTRDHAAPGRVALLIRADLFRRYPNALVSACPAVWNPDRKTRALGTPRQWPIFQGQIGEDFRFFGFDIGDPFGSPDPDAGKPGYYFVLEEHITEPRFGLEPPDSVAPSSTPPSWNDMSWDKVPAGGNFLFATSAPAFQAAEAVQWSENAAAMAFILMRRPTRVAMHASALIAAEQA